MRLLRSAWLLGLLTVAICCGSLNSLKAQTFSDGPMRLRIRVTEVRTNFVDNNELAPDDPINEYVWKVYARDAADVDGVDWSAPLCFNENALPNATAEAVFPQDGTLQPNTVFDHNYNCFTVPKFFDLRLEGYENDDLALCDIDAGDDGVCQANPLQINIDYRLGAPGVAFDQGLFYVTCPGNNGTGLGAFAIRIESYYEFLGNPLDVTLAGTNITCAGANNGTLTATPTGGLAGYTFSWADNVGLNSATRSGLAPGLYTVYVTDANGCVDSTKYTLLQPAPLNGAVGSVTNVTCNGLLNGGIPFTLTGGTAPYVFAWTGPNGFTSALQSLTGIGAGAYSLTVTDANGCTFASSATVTEPAAFSASVVATNVTCKGADNGTLTFGGAGGVAPYTFKINGGSVQSPLDNLAPGSYTIIATDANGCVANASAVITEPALALTTVVTKTNVLCHGAATGSITVSASGGAGAPYTFDWTNFGVSGNTQNNLTAGTYYVNVIDVNNCVKKDTIVIIQPLFALSANVDPKNASCNGVVDGELKVTVSGGTSPYTYAWTGGLPAGPNPTAVAAGSYDVTVTDANGCTISATGTVTQPTGLTLTVTSTNLTCFGSNDGTINITVGGGTVPYTLTVDGAASGVSLTGLSAKTYDILVVDQNGCSANQQVILTEPQPLVSISAGTDVTCSGAANGTAGVTVSGGTGPYTYLWTNGGVTAQITGLAGNTYYCDITDAKGCTVKDTVVVGEPTALSASVASTNVSCNGGSGSLNVTVSGGVGPYTYAWTGGLPAGPNPTAVAAGSYDVTVTDANGCTISATGVVTQPTGLTLTVTSTNPNCFGENGSITTQVGGGTVPYTLTLNGDTIIPGVTYPRPKGTYIIQLEDDNNCTANEQVILTEPTVLAVDTTYKNVTCFGAANGTASVTVTGGAGPYTYQWNDIAASTTPSISGLSPNDYIVNISDANGCSIKSDTFKITQPDALSAIVVTPNTANVSCFGGSDGQIDLEVSGGVLPYTFTWSNPLAVGEHPVFLTPNTYNVVVTDANGCTTTASATITEPAALATTVTAKNLTCFGSDNGEINVATTGGTAPYQIKIDGVISSASTINWPAGFHYILVTDANGCTKLDSVTITQPAVLDVAVTKTDVKCNGANTGDITLTVTGGTAPYIYDWSNGSSAPSLTGLNAGPYTCTVTDANGCSQTISVEIKEPDVLEALQVIAGNVTCNGAGNGSVNVLIQGGIQPYNVVWTGAVTGFNQTGASQTGLAPDTYTYTITDANSCTATGSVDITEPASLTLAYDSTNVTCAGANNGTITITVTGGTSPVTTVNGSVNTNPNLTGLAPGVYDIDVTDANGCNKKAKVTITEPQTLTVDVTGVNITCNAANNGSVATVVAGGTAPYQYFWNVTAPTTATGLTNLAPGKYIVEVLDANGCSAKDSVIVTQPLVVNLTAQATNVSCFGKNDGAINASLNPINGGTPPIVYAWTGPNGYTAPTEDITGLKAGTYVLTATDLNGCSASISVDVTEPAKLVFTAIDTVNISCFGGNNGSITLQVSGGTPLSNLPNQPKYTYVVNNALSVDTLKNLQAGVYEIRVVDANGCEIDTTITLTQPAAPLQLSMSNIDVSCNGLSDGSVKVVATGGTAPYSYQWSGQGTGTADQLTGQLPGVYNVKVIDAKGCTATNSATIDQPTALSATFVKTDVKCNGNGDGTIALTVSQGTSPYVIAWTAVGNAGFTSNASSLIGLAPDTYNYSVTDGNGCNVTGSVVINEPAIFKLNVTSTNVTCFNLVDGNINIVPVGGTAPYVVKVDGNIQTNLNFTKGAGTYQISATDKNGCSADTFITITQPAELIIALAKKDISCYGANDGKAWVTINGGISPYTIQWTGFAPTDTISGLPIGSYTVNVFDANGCTKSGSIGIVQPDTLVALAAATNITCNNLPNGSINLNVTGGTLPYSFAWTGVGTGFVSSSQNISNLLADTYNYVVTDKNGCTSTGSAVVVNPPVMSVTLDTTMISCFGKNDGKIVFHVVGGTKFVGPKPYNIVLNGSISIPDSVANPLGPGIYTYSIKDLNGCEINGTIEITQPEVLFVAISGHNVTCNGLGNGSAQANVTGGTAPYSYSWTNNALTDSISNLAPNPLPYAVTVTDANGCSTTASVIITEPQLLKIALDTINVPCNGTNQGAVDMTVSGGVLPYSVLWNTGATTQDIAGLAPGTYDVTLTDGNGCTATASATVSEPDSLKLSFDVTNLTCNGNNTGKIDMTVSGGNAPYTYQWAGVANTEDLNNIPAGVYNVLVVDSKGCSANGTVTVTQPAVLTATVAATQISCFNANDGKVKVTVAGGTAPYTYAWNASPSTLDSLENLLAGFYEVTVTDSNGCKVTASATIFTAPTKLTLSETHTEITCKNANNGAINLSVSGATPPYTYTWINGATTQDLSLLGPGVYSVVVADANGCKDSLSVTLVEPDTLKLAFDVTNVSCNAFANGAIDMTISGGTPFQAGGTPYNVVWSGVANPTQQNQSGLAAGQYGVTVTDARGCVASGLIDVTQPNVLALVLKKTDVICFGQNNGTLKANVTGGTAPYTYNWNPSAPNVDTLSNLTPQLYTVTVVDAQGCTVSASVTIGEPAKLTASAVKTDITCNGNTDGKIDLTVAGGVAPYTYQWTPAATTEDLSGLAAGAYSVVVTDKNGCTATISAQIINEPSALTVTATPTNGFPCYPALAKINLTVSGGVGGYTYLWSNGATTKDIDNLAEGTYTCVVKDTNGCMQQVSAFVTAPDQINVTFTVIKHITCTGVNDGEVIANVSGGTPPYTYAWGNGDNTMIADNLPAGLQGVLITDANNCQLGPFVVEILPPDPQNPNAGPLTFDVANTTATMVSCNGANNGQIVLNPTGGTPPYQFSLNGGAFASLGVAQAYTDLAPGSYNITVRDSKGCTKSLSNAIVITQELPISGTISIINASCNGSSDGALFVTGSGGTGTLTFLWSYQGAITQSISGLPAGFYTVTIRDANNCTLELSATVKQPDVFTINIAKTNVSCNGGSDGAIDLTVLGGIQPLGYKWYKDNVEVTNLANIQDPQNLTAAQYRVEITNPNPNGPTGLCPQSVTIDIAQPNPFVFTSIQTNVSCSGSGNGTITAAVTGGTAPYSYVLTDPAGVASSPSSTAVYSNLVPGQYTITSTDAKGCIAVENVNIQQPSVLNLTLSRTDVTCNGFSNGVITASILGGSAPYQYSRNGLTFQSSPTFANLPVGTYTITVKDANGCSVNDQITIAAPIALTLSLTKTNVLCNASATGSITATADGGTPTYTYSKDGINFQASATFDSLFAGVHFITVRDGNGCELTKQIQITQPGALVAAAINGRVSCNGSSDGVIKVSATGGVAPYVFSLGGVTFNPVTQFDNLPPNNNYVIYVRDANGCIDTVKAVVTEPNPLVLSTDVTQVTCENFADGKITASATGGTQPYKFKINGVNFSGVEGAKDLPKGVYVILVTDAKGCTATVTDTIDTAFPSLGVVWGIPQTANTGDSLNFTGSGANSFSWDFGPDARPKTGVGTFVSNVVFTRPGQQVVTVRYLVGSCVYIHKDTINVTGSPLAVNEAKEEVNMLIYPNPNNGQFTLTFDNPSMQNVEIRLTNMVGQALITEALDQPTAVFERSFDLSSYAKGVYFLSLHTAAGVTTRKLVIE